MYVQVQVASVLCDSRDLESSSEVKSSAYLQNLQQLTRHFLAPIARTIHQNTHVRFTALMLRVAIACADDTFSVRSSFLAGDGGGQ